MSTAQFTGGTWGGAKVFKPGSFVLNVKVGTEARNGTWEVEEGGLYASQRPFNENKAVFCCCLNIGASLKGKLALAKSGGLDGSWTRTCCTVVQTFPTQRNPNDLSLSRPI